MGFEFSTTSLRWTTKSGRRLRVALIDGLMHLKARRLFYKCEVNAHPKFIKRLLERFTVVLGRDVTDCAVGVLKSEPGPISQSWHADSRESVLLYPKSRDQMQYDIICAIEPETSLWISHGTHELVKIPPQSILIITRDMYIILELRQFYRIIAFVHLNK